MKLRILTKLNQMGPISLTMGKTTLYLRLREVDFSESALQWLGLKLILIRINIEGGDPEDLGFMIDQQVGASQPRIGLDLVGIDLDSFRLVLRSVPKFVTRL